MRCVARALIIVALGFGPLLATAQVPFPELTAPVTRFSMEDQDWSISPSTKVKKKPYHAPTPTSIPGARVIHTLELKKLLDDNKQVIVVDVLDSTGRKSVPGAVWLRGAGSGDFFNAEKERFASAMEKVTAGDKSRPVVFLCLSSECWLSYNAALHALEAGYKDVIWYRGGTNAWRGANLDWTTPTALAW